MVRDKVDGPLVPRSGANEVDAAGAPPAACRAADLEDVTRGDRTARASGEWLMVLRCIMAGELSRDAPGSLHRSCSERLPSVVLTTCWSQWPDSRRCLRHWLQFAKGSAQSGHPYRFFSATAGARPLRELFVCRGLMDLDERCSCSWRWRGCLAVARSADDGASPCNLVVAAAPLDDAAAPAFGLLLSMMASRACQRRQPKDVGVSARLGQLRPSVPMCLARS